MSEAELHVLRARLRGGILNKARRGELLVPPPIGLVYDSKGTLVLDPDQQVQESVRLVFETFRRTGSATATVKAFRTQGLLFPRRPRGEAHPDELVWGDIGHNRVLRSCTIRGMRAPSRLVDTGRGRSQKVDCVSRVCRKASGRSYFPPFTRAISPGKNTRPTKDGCANARKLTVGNAARVPHGKGQRCCKA